MPRRHQRTKGHFDELVEDGFRMGCEGKEGAFFFFGNGTDCLSWMKSNRAHPANAPWCPVQVTAQDGKTTDLSKQQGLCPQASSSVKRTILQGAVHHPPSHRESSMTVYEPGISARGRMDWEGQGRVTMRSSGEGPRTSLASSWEVPAWHAGVTSPRGSPRRRSMRHRLAGPHT